MSMSAQTRTFDFEQDAVGQPPKGFLFAHTAKTGAPGRWVVQQDGGAKCLAQTDADSTRSRFPLAVVSDVSAADVDLSVRFKPISGRVDQAAGSCGAIRTRTTTTSFAPTPSKATSWLTRCSNGKRTDLPVKGEGRTYGKKASVPSQQWGTLRIVANGPRIEVYLNGTKLYEVEDTTFTAAGKVGVWTKADSVTCFDDLTVVTR